MDQKGDSNGDAAEDTILDEVLEAVEDGRLPSRAELIGRYPGRAADVDRALAAATSYRRLVEDERTRRGAGPEPGTLAAGTRLGDFELDGVLGRGEMGVVYRARQATLGGREVALKVLRDDLAARDPRFFERFRREAGLASGVHHPHLAEVYGFGDDDGAHYFAMRLVEGRTLGAVLAGLAERQRRGATDHVRTDFVRSAAWLVRGVASALGALHGHGLVHRDVKPENIILDGAGDDDLDALGRPAVLVDFGLIRPVKESDLTGSMTRLGTLAFAAEELLLGRDVDARADVFSLGAVLHDLLCVTRARSRDAASSGLRSVRAANPAVDARLAAIVEMALQSQPHLRYEDGAALARDLDAWLAGEPIRALPATAFGRARLWARRRPARAAGIGLAGVALFLGGALVAALLQAYIAPLLSAQARAVERYEAGDLPGARGWLASIEERPLGFDLPFLSDARDLRAQQLFSGERELLAALELARSDAAEQALFGHRELRQALRMERPLAQRFDLLRFLCYELEHGGSRARRAVAAETLAFALVRRPPEFAAALIEPGACDAMFDVVLAALDATDSGVAADRALRGDLIACLGGLPDRRALEALLGAALGDDREELRLAVVGAVRIWWDRHVAHRAAGETAWLDVDQAVWVAWLEALWNRSIEFHPSPLPSRSLSALARTPRTERVTGAGIAAQVAEVTSRVVRLEAQRWREASRRNTRYRELTYATGRLTTAIAWTRLELEDAGVLDTECWNSLAPAPAAFVRRVVRQLRDGVPGPEFAGWVPGVVPPPLATTEWSLALTDPAGARDLFLTSGTPYGYSWRVEPVVPELLRTVDALDPTGDATFQFAPLPIGLGGRAEVVACEGVSFSGLVEGGSLSLARVGSSIELRAALPPPDVEAVAVRFEYESLAVFPLPAAGYTDVKLTAGAGRWSAVRRARIHNEEIGFELPVADFVRDGALVLRIERIASPNELDLRRVDFEFIR